MFVCIAVAGIGNGSFPLRFAFRISHFVWKLIVPSPFANVLRFANVRMSTGSDEFPFEILSSKVSGNGP